MRSQANRFPPNSPHHDLQAGIDRVDVRRPSASSVCLGGQQTLQPLSVTGVLFDMGDVLYDATVWSRCFLQLLTRMGLHTHYRAFFRVWRRDYLVDVNCGRCDHWDALKDFLRSLGLTRADTEEVLVAGHTRYAELTEWIRPLPGVSATLARLSALGVERGAINNCDCTSAQLADKLGRMGLRGFLPTVVSSIDLGSVMPDPANYRAALAEMSLPPERVAFVGHCADELAGARAVGMPTIAFNFEPEAIADVYLDRFEQLPHAIDRPTRQLLAG
jgi:HAD superfamily hydrolase (TIGR01509 family)